MRYVFGPDSKRHYRFPTHVNDLVIDRAESTASEVFWVVLEPGEAPPLHKHDDTEQVFLVTAGRGTLTTSLDGSAATREKLRAGDIARIPPSTWHSVLAEGGEMRYLAVDCFPGGRPAAEPTWDGHVRGVCRQKGWDFDEVSGRRGGGPGASGAAAKKSRTPGSARRNSPGKSRRRA